MKLQPYLKALRAQVKKELKKAFGVDGFLYRQIFVFIANKFLYDL